MNEITANIIIKFLKKEFPIKRIKNSRGKWSRAIVIPQGFIRTANTVYFLTKSSKNAVMQHDTYPILIASDIIETISYVFGFSKQEVDPLVTKYLKSIRI
jgi:hypothetical protein